MIVAVALWRFFMFFSPHSTFRAATFIGAGLSMVAYGASASVGLAEPAEAFAGEEAGSQRQPIKVGPEGDLAQCLGHRLEVHLFKGC
jgi:hypothetical protein